jgi:hypothetical protein
MISVSECAALAGLASNELVLGAVPSVRHRHLLSSYLFNSPLGLDVVRGMIVADLRGFLDLGVPARAADLLIVLRLLLTDHPHAGMDSRCAPSPRDADFGVFDRTREAAVVLTFARRSRRVDHDDHTDRCFGDPALARRRAQSYSLRGDR